MLNTVAGNHGTRAIFSTPAMYKYRFGFAAEQIGQNLLELSLRRSRSGTKRDIHIFHAELANLVAFGIGPLAGTPQIDDHFHSECM